MKHIKIYEEDSKELLTTMQGLTLAPKPLGFWISAITYSYGDINAIGIAVVAPDLATIAECLFEEFNLEDFLEDFSDTYWKDFPTILKELNKTLASDDGVTIYNYWKMDPVSTNSKEVSIESSVLANPVEARALGKKFFRNFDEELTRNPQGL